MPPTNVTNRGHSKPSHKESPEHESKAAPKPGLRKGKPVFEVPDEAGRAETAAGWVYREEEEPRRESGAVPAASRNTKDGKRESDAVLSAATQVFVLGATAVGFAALAVMQLAELPFAAGRWMLPNRTR